MLGRQIFSVVLLLTMGLTGRALADEQLRPLVRSGYWIAFAHTPSMIARPDVCMAMNTASGIGVRAEQGAIEIRVMDKDWSLPANITGSISIAVGDYSQVFNIVDNDISMVSAAVPDEQIAPLFTAMDKNASMQVVVGKAKARSVSLVGSAKATAAFRTCAGIDTGSPEGSENPF